MIMKMILPVSLSLFCTYPKPIYKKLKSKQDSVNELFHIMSGSFCMIEQEWSLSSIHFGSPQMYIVRELNAQFEKCSFKHFVIVSFQQNLDFLISADSYQSLSNQYTIVTDQSF